MIRKATDIAFFALAAVLLLVSCPSPVSRVEDEEGDSTFESFFLAPQYNSGLSDTVVGEIREGEIVLEIPGEDGNQYFVPSFTTGASSVTVGGQEQISGLNGHDFDIPVEYTLVSPAGETQVYTVRTVYTGQWNDVGTMPIGLSYEPQLAFSNGIFPFMVNIDTGGLLNARYFSSFTSPSWQPMGGLFGTATILRYAVVSIDGTVWTAHVDSVNPNEVDLYRYDSGGMVWTFQSTLSLDGPIGSLRIFGNDNDNNNVYISVIDSADNLKQAEVWWYDTASWNQLGSGPLSGGQASSLAAGFPGHSLQAAATYEGEPNTLYFYQYDGGSGSWTTQTAALSGYLVQGIFYDNAQGRTVIAALKQNASDNSRSDLNWLSWNWDAQGWEETLPALTLAMSLTDPLSLDWSDDNVPIVASKQYAFSYIFDKWRTLGNAPFNSDPVPSVSVSAGILGYRFLAYQDPSGNNVYVKMVNLD